MKASSPKAKEPSNMTSHASKVIPWLLLVFLSNSGHVSESRADETKVDFNSEIRPLFNRHCTSCHGGVKQASDISFIYEQQTLDSGAIDPGNPENSIIIDRVTSEDPEYRMPPMEEHSEGLSQAEIDLLTRWIEEGATWDSHWAFVKPQAPELPAVSAIDWASQDLDHFVLARLESAGLEPSPAALPAEWLRRVSFDLIGLPPTPAELEEFLQACEAKPQEQQACYRAEVDRLLASPHFGERWAAMWLDLARYADSQGYEKDSHRNVWPYRDWVITAFNQGMSFDDFTIKQLAGDLLPNPTVDDLIATVFHRNTQTNSEGGTDDEEFRVAAVIDRINTTWTVWHGTTFGCTQCHSHPYEPFAHEEYYQFMAFFNNTADHDLGNDDPTIKLPDNQDESFWATTFELEERRRQLREEINHASREVAISETDWQPLVPTNAVSSQGQLLVTEDHEVRVASGTIRVGTTYKVTTAARPLQAIKLAILPESDKPTDWPERGSVVSQVELALVSASGESQPLEIREIIADHLADAYDPMDAMNKGPSGLGGYPKLAGPRWAVLLLAEAIDPPPGSSLVLTLQHRASTTGGQSVHLRRFSLSSSASPDWAALVSSADGQKRWEQLRRLTTAQDDWKGFRVPVMRSRGAVAARPTRVFVRGNWLDLGDLVASGVPKQLHPISQDSPGRLQLARWLVAPDNPLTARVLANRLWAELFGIGIVETLEDFGSTGASPSHPMLLDHLAVKLQHEQKWQIKPFLRDLVLSSTYRQANRVSPELQARDSRNRLLSRGPRTRLTAEMVRDQALRTAGLLAPKFGGPAVMPPQPANVWQTVYNNAQWNTVDGPDRFRRAIYTYWKRTSPYPSFMTFDAPSRELCSARRISTNTPLQALVMLNDPVYFECSQHLATRARKAGGTNSADWIKWSFQTVTQQSPTAATLAELDALYWAVLAEFRQVPEQDPTRVSSPELAALAVVANTILNLDEALTK